MDWKADVLPFAAAVVGGFLVWQAYRYGKATGAVIALDGIADRLASEALGG